MSGLMKAQDHDRADTIHTISAVQNNISKHNAVLVDADMLKNAFTEEYTTSQTNVNILTPTSGYRLCIRTVEIVTDATAGTISLDFLASGKKVTRLYAAAANKSYSNTAHITGNTNEPLVLNTTTGLKNVFLVITYVEHE